MIVLSSTVARAITTVVFKAAPVPEIMDACGTPPKNKKLQKWHATVVHYPAIPTDVNI
jgi:hypothetical protein